MKFCTLKYIISALLLLPAVCAAPAVGKTTANEPAPEQTNSPAHDRAKKEIGRIPRGNGLVIVYGADKKQVNEIWRFGSPHDNSTSETLKTFSIKSDAKIIDEVHISKHTSWNKPSTKNILAFDQPHPDEKTEIGFWQARLLPENSVEDKQQAVTELGRVGTTESVAVLASLLGDEDVAMRRHVVEQIKLIPDKEIENLLGQVLIIDPDPVARRSALEYFAELPGPVSMAFMRLALQDEDTSVRHFAGQALKNLE